MNIATLLLIGVNRHDMRSGLERHGFRLLLADSIEAASSIDTVCDAMLVDASLVTMDVIERLHFLNNNRPIFACANDPGEVDGALSDLCSAGTLECLYYSETAPNLTASRIDKALLFYNLSSTVEHMQEDRHTREELQREVSLHSKVAGHERELNAAIVDSIGWGMFILDPAGQIILCNDQARTLVGATAPDTVGAGYSTVFPVSVSAVIDKMLSVTGQDVTVERVTLNDRFLQVSGHRMRDAEQAHSGFLIFIQDITEQEAMSLQLYRTEKLASIGTMLSGISHELRNPLAIISARCQRLRAKKSPDSEQIEKGLESIEVQSNRCAHIVNNLLNFTRNTATGSGYHKVADVLSETIGYVDYQNTFDDIVVEREFTDGLEIYGDRSRLVQVFLNLVTNAADAMSGKGILTLSTRRESRAWAIVEINDTGPGIPAEIRTKVFDPFYTTKDPGKGTGLGLAIVHKIVQESGGSVWFESQPGDTSFFLKLPSLKERADEQHSGC